ncbi:Metalloenzyme, LuxS/M16 peptidase-like protein [Radiomyces spectabilis]|uniref:Metalloenzyme, LuxS/M16 peptidase-like protein n=1 Tax=Radiomyces spectabilis TaxID=64574 RepID=UPI00221FC56D|nr:Metalloenzyme, LuxS/M16 peptidase-like protein [Radiomyces spectabilis]KAI8393770.1 Metalloenzyme, LuxS/M16 peptidase-like protein [Radiomyces spectabilis]
MASKLLSNTLQSNVNLTKQFVRPLATAAKQAAATRTTVLPNGLTIATEENANAGAATVGVWIDAGSRSETAKTNGAANFLEHLAIKSQASSFEKVGGILNARTTREQTFYAAKTLGASASQSVQILADLIQNPTIDNAAINSTRNSVLREQSKAENDAVQVVFDHLHATAFQGDSMSRPVAGVKETVEGLTAEDLAAYKKENYTASRMVLVGSGDVNHDELVRAAEKSFGQLESGAPAQFAKPVFTGSEIRLRDDVLPQAHIAMAVEGAGYLTPDYFKLAVMQALIGSWDKNLGASANLSSRLSTIVNGNHLANSFASINMGYKNTGLWGIYFATENKTQIDDFVHFTQKEWVRLSTSVTASEVERAKQQLQAGLLLTRDSTCAVAQDIGSQILAAGKRMTADELKAAISKVTLSDVREAANKYLWDQEVAVVGYGPVEGLTDYNRVRGNMSYNRF